LPIYFLSVNDLFMMSLEEFTRLSGKLKKASALLTELSNSFSEDVAYLVDVWSDVKASNKSIDSRLLIKSFQSLVNIFDQYRDSFQDNDYDDPILEHMLNTASEIESLVTRLINLTSSERLAITDKISRVKGVVYDMCILLLRLLMSNPEAVSNSRATELNSISKLLDIDFYSLVKENRYSNLEEVKYSQGVYNELEQKLEETRQLESEFQSIIKKVRAQYDIVIDQRRAVEESRELFNSMIEKGEEIIHNVGVKTLDLVQELTAIESLGEKTRDDYTALMNKVNESEGSVTKLVESAELIKDRLQQLIDPAVASELLSTFERRKKWLFISTILWFVFALISAVSLGWQTSVLLTSPGDLSLERTLSISLRILPFIVLLFFCLRQFTKNRNLEEEYAFRESIATSMMSYVDKIEGDKKLKEELIRDTVMKLYTSPLAKLAEVSKGSSESKQSETLIQSIADLLKQTTSAVKKGE
jgi:hypothetical protein